MNANFKTKLLLKLANKKADKGFTLIELLVVTIIVGVLAAVALPNLLGQVGKARETAAKNGVGAINRAQQAYHFEKQDFAPALAQNDLKTNNVLGVTVDGDPYYNVATANGVGANFVTVTAAPLNAVKDGVRSYSGGTNFDATNGVYSSVITQSTKVLGNNATAPTNVTTPASGYTIIK